MIRSFLAVEVPEEQRAAVSGIIGELKRIPSGVKWVIPDQVHLTLKFFGSISPETVEGISRTLTPIVAGISPFPLSLEGLGGFPNLFRPRVIWLGIGGDTAALKGLQQSAEKALGSIGIPKEDRPFRGHLTIGRNKNPKINEELTGRLSQGIKSEGVPFSVKEVVLFRSDLKPSGSVYTRLKVFTLKNQPDL
ncbi:MAG: RNA 2',3'-cyclic phosphodiesterase [Thermodesulfobacteriota bacterium]